MNQNEFCFKVINAVIARVLFLPDRTFCDASKLIFSLSITCRILYLPDGTFCDASKQMFLLSMQNTVFCMLGHSLMNQNEISFELGSIRCSDCKNTVFCMLGHSLMNQNKFSFEVTMQ